MNGRIIAYSLLLVVSLVLWPSDQELAEQKAAAPE